jgi:hypothetical protein
LPVLAWVLQGEVGFTPLVLFRKPSMLSKLWFSSMMLIMCFTRSAPTAVAISMHRSAAIRTFESHQGDKKV